MADQKKHNLATWLENLQQESWQLELVLSGFSIFLLLGAYEPIYSLDYQIKILMTYNRQFQFLFLPYGILLGAWIVLVFNLLLHVFLRGLWISAIGLRYISHDIDFEQFRFSPRFDQYLRKKIKSFDLYIERLEKICSVIFAFTFLIVFLLLAGCIYLFTLILFGLGLSWLNVNGWNYTKMVVFIFYALYNFFALVYLIDFISFGWIKRRQFLSRIYFPVYRFFSIITLASIYRPLYYNLVDNKFGRMTGLLIIPYIIALVAYGSFKIRTLAYLPTKRASVSINVNSYEDTMIKDRFSYTASIPSKYIQNGYLPLYLPYNPDDDPTIKQLCPDLKPGKTGISFDGFLGDSADPNRHNMEAVVALKCNANRHRIFVDDSLFQEVKFRFYDHPIRENVGLYTVLDVSYLPRKEHVIRIETLFLRERMGKDTLIFSNSAYIPFWIE